MRADIAVVGSGLAALVATRTLQLAGRQPLLIWPGLSSLYFVYATVDVLGYSDARTAGPVAQPDTGVEQLIAEQPDHPYARAGLAALRDGTALLLDWLRSAGLAWQGSLDRNLLLPTATGSAKPSCLLPSSMAAGDLDRAESIVFCGFEGYEDFVPELAAANLARWWRRGPEAVRAVRIALPGFLPGRLLTSIDIARAFEGEAFRREVAARIGQQAPQGTRVGLPAVLGLTHGNEVHARLESEIGHPVFEIPTLPPSVLGLRLFDRLKKHLQETGVEIIWAAPAHTAEVSEGRCRRILLKSAGHEQPVEARSYVLALEDWVDGALRAGAHKVSDPFFHRTLSTSAVPGERAGESLFQAQPYAQVGYPISDRMQPIDEAGHLLAGNVFVAGGAIAGYDPAPTRSRGGLAIATGYRAAKEAMAA